MPTPFTDQLRLAPARRDVMAGLGAATLGLLAASTARAASPHSIKDPAMTPQDASGLRDFDFLFGSWAVRHHKLKRRLAGSDDWSDFAGQLSCRPLIHGLGNMDDNQFDDPAGPYAAVAVRYFNPATRLWTIYWVDGRYPQMEPAVSGAFKDGVGLFYAEDRFEGKPIRVRFRWSDISSSSARWEQAFSPDAGATWEVNWKMEFVRVAA
jgi:hypothetical protein